MQTRKLPLLLAALVGLGAGGAATYTGQSEFAKYRDASTGADAERYHRSTATWDMTRNLTFGAGVVLGVAYLMLKW
jgi:hypothetical protein